MARAWYVSQIYPPPDECVGQPNTTISWFLWKDDIFLVSLSTLYRPKKEGGWDLPNLPTKKSCIALISNETTSNESRYNNVGLDADMGPKCERSQPNILGCRSRKFRISAVFCDGFGVCGRTRAYGIQACIQKKIIEYFVTHKYR